MEAELALPTSVGRYTLTRRLGQGGMGVVYVGRDERLERDVAVKMIAGLSNERAIKRFWREARAAAAISQPNICQIYEVDESAHGIRQRGDFVTILETARQRQKIALAVFERGGGPEILGLR